MIAHGKDIKVFTGNSNPKLAQNICQELGIPLGAQLYDWEKAGRP